MKNIALLFSLFIVNRAISGVVNGLHYAGQGNTWALVLLALSTAVLGGIAYGQAGRLLWLVVAGLVASGLCVALLWASFVFPDGRLSDIHLWTFLHQTALAGTILFAYWSWPAVWALCLMVFPAQFLQKLFVNIIPGGAWNNWATDDPTGETWGIPLLGIRIPRIIPNMETLMVLAVLSVALFALTPVLSRWVVRFTGRTAVAVLLMFPTLNMPAQTRYVGYSESGDSIVIIIPKKETVWQKINPFYKKKTASKHDIICPEKPKLKRQNT